MKTNYTSLRAMLTGFVVLGLAVVGHSAEPPEAGNDQEGEVQTRGPVHEAFAGVVSYNPEPGVVVTKAPPEAIEEVPPEEKPEGDNVTWIPGYWAWDDERSDFLWISGVWRALPPGRQWVPGYWASSSNGNQWTSGYWTDANATETAYLPPPPATLERGPSIEAPSSDYIWAPGCWVWYDSRYAWRPGYWVAGRPDWNWCPAYYSYTPRGYVFVDGYWDYPLERRGCLFAPVYFGSGGYYSRPGFYYSPTIVINLNVFPDHCFYRPLYHHCYFGDYYASSYVRAGFYASFSFQFRRYGYDPIYSHQRWEHRNDRGWDRQVVANYQYRRDHVEARPPRTWSAQASITTGTRSKDRSLSVATTVKELSKRTDGPVRFQPVAKEERQQIVQRSQEVRKTRDERRTLESTAVEPAKGNRGSKQIQPSTAKLPKSPIVSTSTDRLGRDQSPPPRLHRDFNTITPQREPAVIRGNGQSESPKNGYRQKPVPAQPESKPEVERPMRRELKPVVEQPVRRETPPAAQQPVKREVAPAKEAPRETDKGEKEEGRAERKKHQKDEEQEATPVR